LVELIETTPVTSDEWRRQRATYQQARRTPRVRLAFATFFLNRTNHSGILNAGMIGGKEQLGRWKLDARYNREQLVRRIRVIKELKHKIHLSREDGIDFALRHSHSSDRAIMYLDPPYYRAGQRLYLNFYKAADHSALRDAVESLPCAWIVSYDDVPEVRHLYRGQASRRFLLLHTARSARVGKEIMFFAPGLKVPRTHKATCNRNSRGH
jgi:DNA adenine methylase